MENIFLALVYVGQVVILATLLFIEFRRKD